MSMHGLVDECLPDWGRQIGRCVESACVMEVLAPKAGNVSPGKSWNFRDLEVADFLASSRAIRPVFERAGELTVGEFVLAAVRATRESVSTNTNLGQILLLAPLAKAAAQDGRIDQENVATIVRKTSVDDAAAVYEAIALAKPGGMGRRDDQDVADRPSCTLAEAMTLAAGYDDVAAQFAGGFGRVFEIARELAREIAIDGDWMRAIADVHIMQLVRGDTLVRRKCGVDVEAELKLRAAKAVAQRADAMRYRDELEAFDAWLRADGNRRNPGTTADLITAGLFVGLFAGTIELPADLFEKAAAHSKD